MKQRRLSRPGGPHQRQKFASMNINGNIVQRRDVDLHLPVDLRHVPDFHEDIIGWHRMEPSLEAFPFIGKRLENRYPRGDAERGPSRPAARAQTIAANETLWQDSVLLRAGTARAPVLK